MKVHEYQAKELLAEFGIPVPRGGVARTAAEARTLATRIGGRVAVKAQVYAGGRGKAGGIKIAESPNEAQRIAAGLLGGNLVTHQTSPEGLPVDAVLVEEVISCERELYLGIVIDAGKAVPVVMASEFGGVDIEEIAEKTPDKILKTYIDPMLGLHPFQARGLAFGLNLEPMPARPAAELIRNLYGLFEAKDCSLAEINPLIIASDGRVVALDAKLNFDDNALYRHQDIAEMRDRAQENPLEVEAEDKGINNYVKLEGNIGCVVNGAGLAMAVMDSIKLAGGWPANFLDIGTRSDPDLMVSAFKLLNSDPDVKVVLINIFGGMARVDVIATGIAKAFSQMDIEVPVVTRLEGTNLAEGESILAQSGVSLIRAATVGEAAEKAVAAAQTA
ncbi:ADP-forming succinate--CoA ligase subunit beta [Chloroflexota bacterium]